MRGDSEVRQAWLCLSLRTGQRRSSTSTRRIKEARAKRSSNFTTGVKGGSGTEKCLVQAVLKIPIMLHCLVDLVSNLWMALPQRFYRLNTVPSRLLMSTVDISRLKGFALQLPADHPLQRVLLVEKDLLTVDEFLGRIDLWLRLSAVNV